MQARFLEHVAAETLLVGHALENDLRVLKVTHGRVLDTAIMFPHPKVCLLPSPPFLDPKAWIRGPVRLISAV